MDSRDLVLDISSDEGEDDYDYDWISKLLDEVEREGDDSDDVSIMGEVLLNPKQRFAKPTVKDLDDDCVVLDGDPDKPVVIENNAASDDSDDLVVVGEKGQIACRDYPHSRHLCANFPFTSTPHERHCHQCHCYVCDSLAPCVNWGNGTSSNDHCHATDKDEFWKLERQNFKQGDKAPLPVHKNLDTSLAVEPQQTNQCPLLPPLQPNSIAQQNENSRPSTLRACSTSTNFGIPNITNQGRNQQFVYVSSRDKFQPHLVSQHLLGAQNNVIQRDRRHHSDYLRPQVINSHKIFKRAGSAAAVLATNQSGYGSANNNFLTQYCRNPNAYHTPSLQNSGSSLGNSVHCQPRVSSHPNMGSVLQNSVPCQPQVSSHPNMGSVLGNTGATQPQVSFRPNIGSSFVNSVPSLQAFSQLNMGFNFENSVPPQPQVYSQPHMDSSCVNQAPSQTQVHSQPIPPADYTEDGFQQVKETLTAQDPSFSDFDTGWISPTGQSNQQPLADNFQVQSAGPTYHPPLVTDFDPELPVNTNPGSLDFQFDRWMLENQSVLGDLEFDEPSGLNVYSPEPVPVDTGLLFDF